MQITYINEVHARVRTQVSLSSLNRCRNSKVPSAKLYVRSYSQQSNSSGELMQPVLILGTLRLLLRQQDNIVLLVNRRLKDPDGQHDTSRLFGGTGAGGVRGPCAKCFSVQPSDDNPIEQPAVSLTAIQHPALGNVQNTSRVTKSRF
ncbi:hypothetical protein EVAR_83318_1 [Eumeta japonica]|uniref:Uncharacterized protein n=1 Tax=Eumeta variegata TaxID=151549 RepID=A0A4C1VVJ9_EUMVA|nr:hypothetical protein EVAR_83318_1 [Eumeta japonica]